jgi:hypothetical protein
MALLIKDLEYNLHYKPKHWIRKLVLEAKTAISYISFSEEDPMRLHVAKNM